MTPPSQWKLPYQSTPKSCAPVSPTSSPSFAVPQLLTRDDKIVWMAPQIPRPRLSKELPYRNGDIDGENYSDSPLPFSKADPRGKASLEVLNENSPLLTPQRIEDDEGTISSGTPVDELDYLDGEEQVESKSVWYLFVLTLSIGG
ncbi:MAG: hypothetical protein Q9181_000073 [Wetmoreana brouardii]